MTVYFGFILLAWTIIVYVEVVELRNQVDGRGRSTLLISLFAVVLALIGLFGGVVGILEALGGE